MPWFILGSSAMFSEAKGITVVGVSSTSVGAIVAGGIVVGAIVSTTIITVVGVSSTSVGAIVTGGIVVGAISVSGISVGESVVETIRQQTWLETTAMTTAKTA